MNALTHTRLLQSPLELLPIAQQSLERTQGGQEIVNRALGAIAAAKARGPKYPEGYRFVSQTPFALERTNIERNGIYVGHFEPNWSYDPAKKWTGVAHWPNEDRSHRIYGTTRQEIELAVMGLLEPEWKAVADLDIEKVLIVSNVHIAQQDGDALTARGFSSGEFSWTVKIDSNGKIVNGDTFEPSEGLLELLDMARLQRCAYLMLNPTADTVPGVKPYVW